MYRTGSRTARLRDRRGVHRGGEGRHQAGRKTCGRSGGAPHCTAPHRPITSRSGASSPQRGLHIAAGRAAGGQCVRRPARTTGAGTVVGARAGVLSLNPSTCVPSCAAPPPLLSAMCARSAIDAAHNEQPLQRPCVAPAAALAAKRAAKRLTISHNQDESWAPHPAPAGGPPPGAPPPPGTLHMVQSVFL